MCIQSQRLFFRSHRLPHPLRNDFLEVVLAVSQQVMLNKTAALWLVVDDGNHHVTSWLHRCLERRRHAEAAGLWCNTQSKSLNIKNKKADNRTGLKLQPWRGLMSWKLLWACPGYFLYAGLCLFHLIFWGIWTTKHVSWYSEILLLYCLILWSCHELDPSVKSRFKAMHSVSSWLWPCPSSSPPPRTPDCPLPARPQSRPS